MAGINLERRIKRKVWAPQWGFFAACPPGLEGICAEELSGLGMAEVAPEPGGVLFRGRLEEAYRANLWLRSAGRVLLRLADFRVRVLDDIRRQAEAAPWEAFLASGAPLLAQISIRQGSLNHSGAVEEALLKGVTQRLKSLGIGPPQPAKPDDPGRQMIMLRNQDRRAVLSLDTSGAHLHKRGYRLATAKAPLRENLAAALLLFCGYDGSVPFFDPMCGSGTLGIEAALLARGLAPGLERGFAMQGWPAHREPTLGHLQKTARQNILPVAQQAIYCRDKNQGAINAAMENAARAGVADDVDLLRADFFSEPAPGGPGLLVCNPPYGKRIGSVRQAGRFARETARKLTSDYSGWRVGLVLYRPEWASFFRLQNARKLVVPSGGLKLTLLCGLVA